jgi:hypothetical protein
MTEDEIREKEKNKVDVNQISYKELRLIHYQCVFIPKKGILSKDGMPILYKKNEVVVKNAAGQNISAIKELAKENKGKIIRADKAISYLKYHLFEFDKCYVIGRVEKNNAV